MNTLIILTSIGDLHAVRTEKMIWRLQDISDVEILVIGDRTFPAADINCVLTKEQKDRTRVDQTHGTCLRAYASMLTECLNQSYWDVIGYLDTDVEVFMPFKSWLSEIQDDHSIHVARCGDGRPQIVGIGGWEDQGNLTFVPHSSIVFMHQKQAVSLFVAWAMQVSRGFYDVDLGLISALIRLGCSVKEIPSGIFNHNYIKHSKATKCCDGDKEVKSESLIVLSLE